MDTMDEPMTRITWTTRRHYSAEVPTRLWEHQAHAPDELLAHIEIGDLQAIADLSDVEVIERDVESAGGY